MLWLGGFHALDLTTSTPDALCPPLEEARAAVKARAGEARGDSHAEEGLIRGPDGRQALRLLLREGTETVLRRELPLDEAGCDDAAQAIALVLERHFDVIERPDLSEAATPKLESVPATPEPALAQVVPALAPPAPRQSDERAGPAAAPTNAWSARAGLLYDWELGVAPVIGVTFLPRSLEWGTHFRIGAALEIAPFVQRRTETVREQELTQATLQASLSVPMLLRLSSWTFALGPWAHWRFQRGRGPTQLNGVVSYRAVPGLGAFVQLGKDVGARWSVVAGAAFGGQLPGSAAQFVLRKDSGAQSAVLVPQAWFAQAQLGAVLHF